MKRGACHGLSLPPELLRGRGDWDRLTPHPTLPLKGIGIYTRSRDAGAGLRGRSGRVARNGDRHRAGYTASEGVFVGRPEPVPVSSYAACLSRVPPATCVDTTALKGGGDQIGSAWAK